MYIHQQKIGLELRYQIKGFLARRSLATQNKILRSCEHCAGRQARHVAIVYY
jgi:hypothetical protein